VASAAAELRAAGAEVATLRGRANALLVERDGQDDTDFIYPWFFVRNLPAGLLGLVLAAIFVAAMSSLDAQLNSLATSSVMDLWARMRATAIPEVRQLVVLRWLTVFWGLFATVSAFFVARMGPLIEAVNLVGSMFYGSLFGVFVLGWICRRAGGFTGFLALAGGFGCVVFVHCFVRVGADARRIGFFWYNLIGCVAVVGIGVLLSRMQPRRGGA
jgi:Na+/proline symporter